MRSRFLRIRRRCWWLGVCLFGSLATGLGIWGFHLHLVAIGKPHTVGDLVYLTLQLFTLSSGAVPGPVSLPLEVARFLAPAVAANAVALAFLALFTHQTQMFRLRLMKGHVIVCGLGRKGTRLVEQLLAHRKRVVVLEPMATDEELRHCREMGAIVLNGAGNDRWVLNQARVARATAIISVTGDDGTNVETAVLSHQLNQGRKGEPLKCVIHVAEPRLQAVFKQHDIYTERDDPFELEFFNTFEIAARVMLRELPELAWQTKNSPPHLLVVGLGMLGETLLLRAARDWRIDHPNGNDALRITVVDQEADTRKQRLYARFPCLNKMPDVNLHFASFNAYSSDFAKGAFLPEGSEPVTAAYVCLDDDSQAMYTALTLRRDVLQQTPVVVRLLEEGGLATLLGAGPYGEQVIKGIRAVGMLDITCTLDLVLGGTNEILAHAIHQSYVAQQLADGHSPADNPSMVRWERLNDDLKQSNRAQAADIRKKLDRFGYELVPRINGEIKSPITFQEEEIEEMARMEHQRFVRERQSAGWRYTEGPKNIEQRTSSYLVSWDELDESIKNIDRHAVRQIPAVLAKADYEIRPKTS